MDGRVRVSTICCAKRRSYCLIKFQDIYPLQYLKNPNERNRLFTKSFCFILEPISKIRLVFRAQVELCEIPPPGARNGEKAEHTRSM